MSSLALEILIWCCHQTRHSKNRFLTEIFQISYRYDNTFTSVTNYFSSFLWCHQYDQWGCENFGEKGGWLGRWRCSDERWQSHTLGSTAYPISQRWGLIASKAVFLLLCQEGHQWIPFHFPVCSLWFTLSTRRCSDDNFLTSLNELGWLACSVYSVTTSALGLAFDQG